jgi:hypothetical protein
LSTFLYVIAGWALFNIVVAVGMYFRPVRKPGPDNPNASPSPELTRQSSNDASNASPRRDAGAEHGKPLPPGITRLLFFGFWLNDRVRARPVAVERERT